MAIYHFHVGVISRKTGRSAVGASAYRSAEKLKSDYDGITHNYHDKTNAVNASAYRSGERLHHEQGGKIHDYTRKRGVVHTEIMLPHNAPSEYSDRGTLWNAVEKAEKRKDAQTARDIDVSLPVEFSRQEQIDLMREYIKENFAQKGMIADFAIHDKSDGNPHAHILLTTRNVDETGFKGKNRDWNNKAHLEKWRENWANACNERLQADKHIDSRTLKAQGIDREPLQYIGVEAWNMEKRGIRTERGDKNRAIIARNTAKQLHQLKENYISLEKEISELQDMKSTANRESNRCRVTAEEMAERAETIGLTKAQLEDLKETRQNMGFFKRKERLEIDNQIENLERSNTQAKAYFRRNYNIDVEESYTEIKRLEATAESKNNLHTKIKDKLKPLIEQREQNIFEYQRQKLLVEIRHDREKIHNHLEKLEHESQVYKRLVKDDILRTRCNRQLNNISQFNFEKIIKTVTIEKATALIKQREIKTLIQQNRRFDRGRF